MVWSYNKLIEKNIQLLFFLSVFLASKYFPLLTLTYKQHIKIISNFLSITLPKKNIFIYVWLYLNCNVYTFKKKDWIFNVKCKYKKIQHGDNYLVISELSGKIVLTTGEYSKDATCNE